MESLGQVELWFSGYSAEPWGTDFPESVEFVRHRFIPSAIRSPETLEERCLLARQRGRGGGSGSVACRGDGQMQPPVRGPETGEAGVGRVAVEAGRLRPWRQMPGNQETSVSAVQRVELQEHSCRVQCPKGSVMGHACPSHLSRVLLCRAVGPLWTQVGQRGRACFGPNCAHAHRVCVGVRVAAPGRAVSLSLSRISR